MNKSNLISHVFNSSFYSESLHQKSETSSEEKNKNLNISFLSHKENYKNELQ